jgi:hypothetical protein
MALSAAMNQNQSIGMPKNQPDNLNMAVLAFYIDTDDPAHRIPIQDVIVQIAEMDMEPGLRNSHIAGLLAARLSLKYLEANMDPVHEKARDVGILAMLGCHITEHVPLTPAEMDNAETYQRIILHTRVLNDFEPGPEYAQQTCPSAASQAQTRIRSNLYGYQGGRAEFSRMHASIVTDYTDFIGNTPPTGDRIASYREDEAIAPVVERFLHTRRSLLSYAPELAAQEHELWQYARNHYARHILPHLPPDRPQTLQDKPIYTTAPL